MDLCWANLSVHAAAATGRRPGANPCGAPGSAPALTVKISVRSPGQTKPRSPIPHISPPSSPPHHPRLPRTFPRHPEPRSQSGASARSWEVPRCSVEPPAPCSRAGVRSPEPDQAVADPTLAAPARSSLPLPQVSFLVPAALLCAFLVSSCERACVVVSSLVGGFCAVSPRIASRLMLPAPAAAGGR